jgi:20S proteasome alpha/beta subunit
MAFLNKVNALVGTGLFQDFHRIVERAKFDSISFRENFSSVLVGKVFASRIASLIHLQTKYWHIRPLCCSLFLATINLGIPELYILTQTGQYLKCFSGSLGEKSEIFKITIDKLSEAQVTCRESIQEIFRLFKKAKKEIDYRYLEVLCFSMDNLCFKTPISCNLMIEVNRRFLVI